ncbi:unnamed protein product [Pipistrellus nathusii]|uniref:Transmembrane protein 238 n=1 Tax=Pipistrellus nathusii TaxID=59473 RepID=A0ABP0A5V6_PIPNA
MSEGRARTGGTAHAQKAARAGRGDRTRLRAPPRGVGGGRQPFPSRQVRGHPAGRSLAPPPARLTRQALLWGSSGRGRRPGTAPPLRTRRRRQREVMEPPRSSDVEARRLKGLGRCRQFFWLGVAFDAVGATVLFVGIFSDLIFYDLLLYLGSIIIFLSLLWWVFWYTGNIELSPEDTWKRPIRMGTLDQHFSFTLNLTNTLARFRRDHRRRLFQNTTNIQSPSFSIQVPDPLAKEDQVQDKGRRKSVRYRDEANASGREDLGPEPEMEAVKRSERVGPPGPEAGPLGPEARRSSGHLVHPKFTPSEVLDHPLPPDIASSKSLTVVSSSSVSQPLTINYSKSLPTSLTSESNPLITITSVSLPGVPLPSSGQPLDTLASDIETVASGVSQNYPLVHVAAVSHFPTPVDSERDFQSHSLDTQNQASQTHLTPGTFFQTQPVHPWVTVADQDFQSLYNTQPSSMVQEIERSQFPLSQEPSGGQELSQEVPDTISQLPESESVAPATEAQKSMPHENVPAPTTQNGGHL